MIFVNSSPNLTLLFLAKILQLTSQQSLSTLLSLSSLLIKPSETKILRLVTGQLAFPPLLVKHDEQKFCPLTFPKKLKVDVISITRLR